MTASFVSSWSFRLGIAGGVLAFGGCNLYGEELLTGAGAPSAGSASVTETPGNGGTAASAGSTPGAGAGAEPNVAGGAASEGGEGGAGGALGSAAGEAGTLAGDAGAGGESDGPIAPTLEVLLDDLEDADLAITGPGYSGHWYAFADELSGGSFAPNPMATSSMDPSNALNPESAQAIRLIGKFAGWGVGLGFALVSTGQQTFDASGFSGVSFWGRLGETSHQQLVVSIGDPRCDDCINPPERLLEMSQEWARYYLPFDSFHQSGVPTFDTPNPATLGPIQLRVRGGQQLDVWLDDVAFYVE